jgi:hypothetical protein
VLTTKFWPASLMQVQCYQQNSGTPLVQVQMLIEAVCFFFFLVPPATLRSTRELLISAQLVGAIPSIQVKRILHSWRKLCWYVPLLLQLPASSHHYKQSKHFTLETGLFLCLISVCKRGGNPLEKENYMHTHTHTFSLSLHPPLNLEPVEACNSSS